MYESTALDVGDDSPAGIDQFVRLDAEHAVPGAGSRPHLGPLQQVPVDEDAQLSCVTKGGTPFLVLETLLTPSDSAAYIEVCVSLRT